MHVLVIDDDAVTRLALSEVIKQIGIDQIYEFENGADAMTFLCSRPEPILVCCDIRMPQMSGTKLLKVIRNDPRLSKLPFVLITSGADRDTVREAIQLRVAGYIVKPFTTENATEKLQSLLDGQWSNVAESLEVAAKRLGITHNKLHHYYKAFQTQIEELEQTISGNVRQQFHQSLMGQFSGIHKGCLTLGLWYGARVLQPVLSESIPYRYAQEHVDALKRLVDHQLQGF